MLHGTIQRKTADRQAYSMSREKGFTRHAVGSNVKSCLSRNSATAREAPKWTIAMMGLPAPNTRLNLSVIASPNAFSGDPAFRPMPGC
jgi:hypothetical protein